MQSSQKECPQGSMTGLVHSPRQMPHSFSLPSIATKHRDRSPGQTLVCSVCDGKCLPRLREKRVTTATPLLQRVSRPCPVAPQPPVFVSGLAVVGPLPPHPDFSFPSRPVFLATKSLIGANSNATFALFCYKEDWCGQSTAANEQGRREDGISSKHRPTVTK